MAHIGQELALCGVGGFGALTRLLKLPGSLEDLQLQPVARVGE